MSSLYDTLKNSLFNNKNDELLSIQEINDGVECVKYSSRTIKGGAKYMKAEDFNEYVKKYIDNKIKNNDFLTDCDNNINIHDAYNTLYIDLDFYITTSKEDKQETINTNLLKLFIESVETNLKENGINNFYYLPFVATEYTKKEKYYKGGSHTMFITDSIISKDNRQKIYNDIINYVVENVGDNIKSFKHYIKDFNDKDLTASFKTIFDYSPIKSVGLLMPFAQKEKTSRRYKLYFDLMNYHKENFFILNTQHNITTNSTTNEDEKLGINELVNYGKNETFYNPKYLLTKEAYLIYEFIDSFKYLSRNHKMWSILYGDHNNYYYNFAGVYYKLLIMFNICSSNSERSLKRYKNKDTGEIITIDPFEAIGKLVAKQLSDLCKTCSCKMAGRKRWQYENQFNNLNNMIITKFKETLTSTKKFNEIYNDLITEDEEDNEADYSAIRDFNNILSAYFFIKKYGFDLNIRKNKELRERIDGNILIISVINSMFAEFKNIVKTSFDNFIVYITSEFKHNISDEIEPFNKNKSYDNPICYIDEKAEHKEVLTFYDVDKTFAINYNGAEQVIKDTTYMDTMKIWITILLSFEYYNSEFQLQEAIKHTICAFIKNYIVTTPIPSTAKNSKATEMIMVYNIRQTIELEKYPYNQWIGNATQLIIKWLNKLYDNYISKALESTQKNKGVKAIIDILYNNKIINNIKAISSIKPLGRACNDLNEMFKNILAFHNAESSAVPETILIESANIFPMRNGWLQFNEENGDLTFITNTRDKYLGSGTNIPWVGDRSTYEKYIQGNSEQQKEAHKAFHDVSTMIEQIYPNEEERIYNMKLFASVLYGCGEKNVLHVMFGTGADGKTTMINALFGMLDAQGFTSDVHTYENNRKIEVLSIRGLAETMNAKTLLISDNKSGSHDEGGRANIAHMRLVSVQEPDQHLNGGCLNGAVIKELTSGSTISARKIYGESESVQANALICFQTNICPGTDDTSRGFRRRLSLYQHKSKFWPKEEYEKKKKCKNHFLANPKLGENIKHRLSYKQAMFYYLLPYAIENIKNKNLSLQGINKPPAVQDGIRHVINNSNGVPKWLADNLQDYDESIDETCGIINIHSLIQLMRDLNSKKDGSLWGKFKLTTKEETTIINAIQNHCEGSIYRLKKKYYKKSINGITYKLNDKVDNLKEFVEVITDPTTKGRNKLTMTYEEYLNKYLKANPVANTNESKCDYKDLFIIGYVYKTIDSKLFKDDNDNDKIDDDI